MRTCRLCDEPESRDTWTHWKGRPAHRSCLRDLCRLMPHWVPDDVKKDDS